MRKKEYLYRIVFNHKQTGNLMRYTLCYYPDSMGDVTAWRLYNEGHPMLTRSGKAGYATVGHAARALRNIMKEYSADPCREICFYATERTLRDWATTTRK